MFEFEFGAGMISGPAQIYSAAQRPNGPVARNGRRAVRASLALTARDGGMAARLAGDEDGGNLDKVSTASSKEHRGTRRAGL